MIHTSICTRNDASNRYNLTEPRKKLSRLSVNVIVYIILIQTVASFTAHYSIKRKSYIYTNLHSQKFEQEENKNTLLQLEHLPRLTVVLPAYNEEDRLEETIVTYRSYLANSKLWGRDGGKFSSLLVVDDGSTDGTCDVVSRQKNIKPVGVGANELNDGYKGILLNCISLIENEGKGAAIGAAIENLSKQIVDDQKGCLDVDKNGWVILIADADGSGNIKCLDRMVYELATMLTSTYSRKNDISESSLLSPLPYTLWNYPAIVVGDRGFKGTSPLRAVTRWGFRTTVQLFCGGLSVKDTQCGFKVMTLTAGKNLYANLNLKSWTHDVEVLYRAKEMNLPVSSSLIEWQDKEGSKLEASVGGTLGISIVMLFEVLSMRLAYLFGRYRVPDYDWRTQEKFGIGNNNKKD